MKKNASNNETKKKLMEKLVAHGSTSQCHNKAAEED